jgi:hypothetical protein
MVYPEINSASDSYKSNGIRPASINESTMNATNNIGYFIILRCIKDIDLKFIDISILALIAVTADSTIRFRLM